MMVCGVTGPSGAGKGFFCSLLDAPDIYIIDIDKVYHEMTDYPSECLLAIKERFGPVVINNDGSLNRQVLGSIVFNDKSKLDVLNAITHPLIVKKCHEIIDEKKNQGYFAVVVDAPLLFESELNRECDLVIAVISDKEERIRRISKRDNISRKKAEERISSQHSNDFYSERADITVINNGDEIFLQAKRISKIIRDYNKE